MSVSISNCLNMLKICMIKFDWRLLATGSYSKGTDMVTDLTEGFQYKGLLVRTVLMTS